MRVVEISEFGGPDVLTIAQRPTPKPGSGEVLIKVVAAGVNRPDVVQRYGKYPPPPGASDIPGLEVSGHVAALGDGVVQWQEGDAVCALVSGGGYSLRQEVTGSVTGLRIVDDAWVYGPLEEMDCSSLSNWEAKLVTIDSDYQVTGDVGDQPCG